jgi:hypothetical protein
MGLGGFGDWGALETGGLVFMGEGDCEDSKLGCWAG